MRRGNPRAGFTLVELIVVLALSALLLGIGTLSMMGYVKRTTYDRQQEYARSLFLAAQLQLTQYETRGQLKAFSRESGQTAVPPFDLVGREDKDGAGAAYQGTVCYLTGDARAYAAYQDGTASDEENALYGLLDGYVYDKSILNAAVCVEFDPQEGLVYSVFYSDRNDAFTYGTEQDGAASIRDRSAEALRARMIGYYGVDSLSQSPGSEPEKPDIGAINLNNEDTLNLTFGLNDIPEALLELRYRVDVYDAETGFKLLGIEMNDPALAGGDPDGEYILRSDPKGALRCRVDVLTGPQRGTRLYDFPCYADASGTIHLTLDAADLGASEDAWRENAGSLADTYSFRRFGLNADSIYCTVSGSGDGYETSALKTSRPACVYFGSCTESAQSGPRAYTLFNARHLYNMRYVECTDAADATFTVTSDFGWDTLRVVYGPDHQITDTAEFPMMERLREGDTLQSDGPACTISGIRITAPDEDRAGLFRENRGTIRNLALDRIQVTGGEEAGSFCGGNSGELSGLRILSGEASGAQSVSGSFVTGGGTAGGIAGVNGGTIRGCGFDGSVTGSGKDASAGGIAGKNLPEGSIEACFVGIAEATTISCGTSSVSGGFAGGIAGWNQGSVMSCDNEEKSQAASVSVSGCAGYLGGIVGFNDQNAVVTGTEEAPLSTGENWEVHGLPFSGGSFCGGIIGANASSESVCYVRNFADTYCACDGGESAAGGVIGRQENQQDADFCLTDAENHAEVWSVSRCGGLVGAWKDRGGAVTGCFNYGTVGKNPEGGAELPADSSGMVAGVYDMDGGQSLTVTGCKNYGLISDSGLHSAGFVADAQGVCLIISDCVNTGTVLGSGVCAGFLAGKSAFASASFCRCRNYGLGASAKTSGFAGISAVPAARMEDCLDYSNNYDAMPLTSAPFPVSATNRYVGGSYGQGPKGTKSLEERVQVSTAVFAGAAGAPVVEENDPDRFFPLLNTFDADPATSCCVHYKDHAPVSAENKNAMTLTYNLAAPTDLAGVAVRWCNDAADPASSVYTQYTYRLSYAALDPESGAKNTVLYHRGALLKEVGAPEGQSAEHSAVYHAFSAYNVTQIVLEITDIRRKDSADASWDTDASCIGDLGIYDLYAAKAGTAFDPANPEASMCVSTGAASGTAQADRNGAAGTKLRTVKQPQKTYDLQDGLTDSDSLILAGLTLDPLGKGTGVNEAGKSKPSLRFFQDYSLYEDDFTSNPENVKSYRYRLIGQIEPKLLAYYKGLFSDSSAPTGLTAAMQSGGMQLSWSHAGACAYEISALTDGERQIVASVRETSAFLVMPDGWAGKDVTFQVRAVTWKYDEKYEIFTEERTDWSGGAAVSG